MRPCPVTLRCSPGILSALSTKVDKGRARVGVRTKERGKENNFPVQTDDSVSIAYDTAKWHRLRAIIPIFLSQAQLSIVNFGQAQLAQ